MLKTAHILLIVLLAANLYGETPGVTESHSDKPTELRYPLQPFDSITVSIFNQADLSASQRISDIGTIALPLIGEVKVAGLTTSEAQKVIASAYIDQEYLVNPIVTVHIENFTSQTVTVLGEVNGSGQIVFPDGVQKLPIQEIIAMAGDFSDIAKNTEVRIERPHPRKQKPEVFIINVKNIIESTKNKEAVDTFMIRPGDIIFVPRRAF